MSKGAAIALIFVAFIIVSYVGLVFLLWLFSRPKKRHPKADHKMKVDQDEKFNFKFKLFPDDKDEIQSHPELEFTLKCPKCGKNLVLDQFAEDGFSQNPDGSWWVCRHCEMEKKEEKKETIH